MFLNEDFLSIYEELSSLNEAKADIQKLVDFAGADLAKRFLLVKNNFKAPENDLYYWIKYKTPADLERVVTDCEDNKSNTQVKKEVADEGAELIQETEHWKVYHITTYAASQKYGRDTKWCITGVNNYGDKYWNQYTKDGIQFYFLISKDAYNARGRFSKFAIAKHPDVDQCEIYDQQDNAVDNEYIPHREEIDIPGVDLTQDYTGHTCENCGIKLYDNIYDDGYLNGPDDKLYCEDCWDKLFFMCRGCGEIFDQEKANKAGGYRDWYCDDCFY
jgi:hypothetical protein